MAADDRGEPPRRGRAQAEARRSWALARQQPLQVMGHVRHMSWYRAAVTTSSSGVPIRSLLLTYERTSTSPSVVIGCLNQRSGVSSMKASMLGRPMNPFSIRETITTLPVCVRMVSPTLTSSPFTFFQESAIVDVPSPSFDSSSLS